MRLPGQDDFYDVDIFNDNTRLIDGALHELARRNAKELVVTILTSGIFRPADYGLSGASVDVYLVGGGGNTEGTGLGGGGGGRCVLLQDVPLAGDSFPVTVGVGGAGGTTAAPPGTVGGSTSAFSQVVTGGEGGGRNGVDGGNGGSGGGGGGGALASSVQIGGGSGGFGGSAGNSSDISRGGTGSGNVNFTPINPYDNIAYGSGGGGNRASGGGAGGRGSGTSGPATAGFVGGGGGGAQSANGGAGGLGGGGGGGTTFGIGGRGGDGLIYIYAVPQTGAVSATLDLQVGEGMPAVLTGRASLAEICDFDAACKEQIVRIGVLQGEVCTDVAVFQNLETAEQFLGDGIWPEADGVAVLSEGYGIGDCYDGENWAKQEPSL